MNGDLKFKLRQTLASLSNQGHEVPLRGGLIQIKNVTPKTVVGWGWWCAELGDWD